MQRYAVTTPPAAPLVSLSDAKDHLRVIGNAEDAQVTAYANAAIQQARDIAQCEFVAATITWRPRDGFGAGSQSTLLVPRGPLASVTSIKYRDASDTLLTLDPALYSVDPFSRPGSIEPIGSWPIASSTHPVPVEIEYVAGLGQADIRLDAAKQAVKLLLGHYYANREAVVTGTIATEIDLAVMDLLAAYDDGIRR